MSRPSHSAWVSCSASAFAASSAKALAMPVRPRAFSRSRVGWVNMSFSFSVVVAGAADIGVVDGFACRRARRRRLIETLVEDGAHRAVGPRADFQRTAAGGVDPFPAKALGEADDAQTGAKALLGMRPIAEASRSMRSLVQSAKRRCAEGMCSGTVVCRPLPLERM